MCRRRCLHGLLALVLIPTNVFGPSAAFATARAKAVQTAQVPAADFSARLAALETELETKRQEYGVPGFSLAVVKDDQVVLMKGFGLRDVERKLPVTPDTLFAIGSASKAFTAMTAMMTVDEGKLVLDDSPKKYLPYFKLRDPETDAKITVRDLMCHSSGLNRTDLAWISGTFTRQEMIQIAGQAKPTAKLREKFQYQNVMYVAAGEVVAAAQKQSWEQFVTNRIFKPLGMKVTNLTKLETERAKDYALGYSYIKSTKETKRLPMRDITRIAPAGAINSSAREMAAWVRLMLGGGRFDGKRLVSEKSYAELIKQQMKVSDKIGYGLGWFIRDWNGHQAYDHGGNIDGFSSMVAFMPDRKLGFVYLSNANGSSLADAVRGIVWKHLAGDAAAMAEVKTEAASGEKPVAPQDEAGTYRLAQANVDFTVAFNDGRLALRVPGQPTYPLENIGGRRYKLAAPAPDGFFITFRPAKEKVGESEAYLEQPHGNFVLTKLKAEAKAAEAKANASYAGPMKELLGSYQGDLTNGPVIEIKLAEGRPALWVPGQPAYPLKEVEKDVYGSPALSDAYRLVIKRDEASNVSGFVLKQPEGEFVFKRLVEAKVDLTADELMAKVVAAMGGEANLRRHRTMVMRADVDFVHQGVTGEIITWAKAPNLMASEATFVALGRKFGTIYEYFDGAGGGEGGTFMPVENYAGKNLDDKRIAADFYQVLNWKTLFKTVEVRKRMKLDGEDVYVVVKTPEKGNPVTDYVSAKTFLVVKRELLNTTNSGEITLPSTETFSDYRYVDGVMLPFKTVTSSLSIGDTVVQVKEVKFDVDVPEQTFRARVR